MRILFFPVKIALIPFAFSALPVVEEIHSVSFFPFHRAEIEVIPFIHFLHTPQESIFPPACFRCIRYITAVYAEQRPEHQYSQLPAQGIFRKITSGKLDLSVPGDIVQQKGFDLIRNLLMVYGYSPIHFIRTFGGYDNDVCLIAGSFPDEDFPFFHLPDIVIQIGQRDAGFQTDLLNGECVVIAGAQNILSDLALHKLPEIIRSLSVVHGEYRFGIVAEFSEGSFHMHSFFHNFSGFEQQIFHHTFGYGKRRCDFGTGKSVNIVQNRCPAIFFGQQSKFPAEQKEITAVLLGERFFCGNVVCQFAGIVLQFLSVPLFIDISGNAPHESVKRTVIPDIFSGSEQCQQNIL